MEAAEVVARESNDFSEEQAVADHRKARSERRHSLDKGKAKAQEGLAKQDRTSSEGTSAQSSVTVHQAQEDSTADANKLMPGGFPDDTISDSKVDINTTDMVATVTTAPTIVEPSQEESTTSSPTSDHAQQSTSVDTTVPVSKARPSLLDDDPIPLVSIAAKPETASATETVDWQKAPLDFDNISELSACEATGLDKSDSADKKSQDQTLGLVDFDEPSTEQAHIPVLSLTDQGSWSSILQPQGSDSLKTSATSGADFFKTSATSTGSGASDKVAVDPASFNMEVWDNFDDRNAYYDFAVKAEYDESEEEEGEKETGDVDMFTEAQSRAQSTNLHQHLTASQGGDQFIGRFAPAVRSQPKDVRKASIVTVESKGPDYVPADQLLGMFQQSRKSALPSSTTADKLHPSAEPVPLYPSLATMATGQQSQEGAGVGSAKEGAKEPQNPIIDSDADEELVRRSSAAATTATPAAADDESGVSSKDAIKTSSQPASSEDDSNADPFGLNTPEAIAQRRQWNKRDLEKKASYGLSTSPDDATSASPAGYTDTDGAYVSTGYDTDSRKPVPSAQRRKEQEDVPQPRSPSGHVRHAWTDLPPIVSVTDSEFSHRDQQHSDLSDFFPTGSLGGAMASTTKGSTATSQEPGRTKLYPPAPVEPWGPPQPDQESAGLRHRSSTHDNSASPVGPITSDPPLTFLRSTRGATAKPTSSASASGALLGELPATMLGEKLNSGGAASPKAKASKTLTLPANPKDAPVLRGQYELPSMKEVQQWNTAHGLGPYAFRRLTLNVGGLMVSSWVWRRAVVVNMAQKLASMIGYDPLYWLHWGLWIVFWINIGDALWRYSKASNKFEKLPLTAEQRLRLGLDPSGSSVPGAVPVFQNSTSSKIDLLAVPLRSTYVAPSTQRATGAKLHAPLGKSLNAAAAPASVIWSKSMSKSLQPIPQVHTKRELQSLIKTVESREGADNEWRMAEAAAVEANKRATTFALGVSDRLGGPLAFGVGAAAGAGTGTGGADAAGRKPDARLGLSVSRYQPALRTTLSKDRISKTELQMDGLPVWTPAKVLKTLKVSEAQLDRWVLRMRKWLWTKVVSPMCEEMEAVDKAFDKAGFGYLDCKSATMFTTSTIVPQKNAADGSATGGAAGAAGAAAAGAAGAGASTASNPLGWGAAAATAPQLPSAFAGPIQPALPSTPTSLKDLNDRWGNDEMVRRRMVLEAYLAVPGVTNRKYVVERIQAFGALLSQFKWDSEGVRWDNGRKGWTPDLPTDSQILMHLFATFLDLAMPAQPLDGYGRFPFSYKHLVSVDVKPDPNVAIQIKQSAKNPPCYHLVVNGNVWEIVPKRMNIWYTLVLFIYVVMKESGGYLGQTHFGSRALGLDSVVEG
ncbi:hypothetical protein DFQ26_002364 [Actinomortierella ambigua]|nr:hypothetical protein DFQ26_002364 [Actinomortierella ambigua]